MSTYTIQTKYKSNSKHFYQEDDEFIFKETVVTFHNVTKEFVLKFLIEYCDCILDKDKNPKEPELNDVISFAYYNNDETKLEDILKYYKSRYETYKDILSKLEYHDWLQKDIKFIEVYFKNDGNEFGFDIGKYEKNIVNSITISID